MYGRMVVGGGQRSQWSVVSGGQRVQRGQRGRWGGVADSVGSVDSWRWEWERLAAGDGWR